MLNIQDADYIVKNDELHRNRRARAYHRRAVRRRIWTALVDAVTVVAAVSLIWFVWSQVLC